MSEYKSLVYWLHLVPDVVIVFIGLILLDILGIIQFYIANIQDGIIAFIVIYALVAVVDIFQHDVLNVE